MIVDLDCKLLHPDVRAPVLASDGAACFDLHAYMPTMQAAYVLPGEAVIVHTGIAFAFPKGWCMEVYSRSGHGAKCRVSLANSTGIIDSDYRGELLIALANDGKEPFIVRHGDRIAQFKMVQVPTVRLRMVEELGETARGEGGFGSTGPGEIANVVV